MPTSIGSDDLDAVANYWRTLAGTAGRLVAHLVSSYTVGQTYAQVLTNSLGSTPLLTADITVGAGSAGARTITVAGKPITLQAGNPGSSLHYVIVDTVSSVVRAATNATSSVVPLQIGAVWNNAGNPIVITLQQPA